MIINGRKLVFKKEFDDMVDEIEKFYLSEGRTIGWNKFIKELIEILSNKIPKNPEGYPEYQWKKTSQKLYRRYLFRKNYYIVFKVEPKNLTYLAFVYARRNLSEFPIE